MHAFEGLVKAGTRNLHAPTSRWALGLAFFMSHPPSFLTGQLQLKDPRGFNPYLFSS